MKVLIIEDEPRTQKAIVSVIKRCCNDMEVKGAAGDVQTSVALIKEHDPDLVLMDIKLSDGTAFDILKIIDPVRFKIIFITAYEDYAVQAIKFSAFDYILKPFSEEELVKTLKSFVDLKTKSVNQQTLQTLLDNLKQNGEKKIVLKTVDNIFLVAVNDIIRCEADSSYTHIFLLNGEIITVSSNLKEHEGFLKYFNFFRVHHSHLININHIIKFNKNQGTIEMKDGSIIPVSKRKKEVLIDFFDNL